MDFHHISRMINGWFVGDFERAIHRTPDFEVSYMRHHKGQEWPKHHHKISKEINLLMRGKMLINEYEINPGEIFVIHPGESAKPTFLEDCELVVVKVPSRPEDKYVDE